MKTTTMTNGALNNTIEEDSASTTNHENRNVETPNMVRGTIITICIKCISFLGTQYCIRKFHTPITLGSNVKLELLMVSILFLSREGFRLAITNSNTNGSNSNDQNTRKTTDHTNQSSLQLGGSGVALLTIPVTFITSIIAFIWHYYYYCNLTTVVTNDGITSTVPIVSNEYKFSGLLFCVAAFIEGCGEPVILYRLQNLSITEKASAEGIATFSKTLTTIVCMNQSLLKHQTFTSLGIAQIAYSLTYCLVLYGTMYHRGLIRYIIPINNMSDTTWWHAPTIRLVILFTIQGLFKFALTEGDRIVLSIVANNYDQGLYALGCTYGGLAARLLLQPLEETARLLFSRLATSPVTVTERTQQHKQVSTISTMEVSYTVFVKIVLYIGLIFCCVAANYTFVLLNVLAGTTWGNNAEAVDVLSAFCIYTAFLAWNGMTEAFVYGISQTASDVGRLGIAHTVTGVMFAVVAPVAVTKYGTIGLVATNCITMLSRTAFSIFFAARYFCRRENERIDIVMVRLLRQMIPIPIVLSLFVIAYIGTKQSFNRMNSSIRVGNVATFSATWIRLVIEHVGVGISFGVGILSVAYVLEGKFKQNIRTIWREKQA